MVTKEFPATQKERTRGYVAGFGCTAYKVRGTALIFAENRNLKRPRRKKKSSRLVDCYLKRNRQFSFRNAEGLSNARAAGINRIAVEEYFELAMEIAEE
jgi:hypothetical protein